MKHALWFASADKVAKRSLSGEKEVTMNSPIDAIANGLNSAPAFLLWCPA